MLKLSRVIINFNKFMLHLQKWIEQLKQKDQYKQLASWL